MANRSAIASGLWSNAATWSGSLIPTASDDVYANGNVVVVDTNISVLSLRTTSSPLGTAGGNFILNGGINITASSILSGTTSCVIYSASVNSNILGNITGSSTLDSANYGIYHIGSGVLTISGSLFGGGFGSGNDAIRLNTASAKLNIKGTINGGGAAGASALYLNACDTVNIYGDVYGSVNLYRCNNGIVTLSGILNIYGNVYGGSYYAAYGDGYGQGIRMGNTAIVNILGNLYLQSFNRAIDITTNGPSLNVTGSLFGGQALLIYNPNVATIKISGSCYASNTSPAISSTANTSTNIIAGRLINNGSMMAFYGPRLYLQSGSTVLWNFVTPDLNASQSFYTSDIAADYPAARHVRNGISYASASLVGTCAIPPTASVGYGVPVDIYSGSAIFAPINTASLAQQVWDYLVTNISGSDTIGTRLKNNSTVQTTAAQIAAFKI